MALFQDAFRHLQILLSANYIPFWTDSYYLLFLCLLILFIPSLRIIFSVGSWYNAKFHCRPILINDSGLWTVIILGRKSNILEKHTGRYL